MNRFRLSALLALAVLIVLIAWWRPPAKIPTETPPPSQPASDRSSAIPAALPISSTPVPSAISRPPGSEEFRASSRRDFTNPLAPSSFEERPTRTLTGQNPSIAAAFDQINLMFRDYRTITGENPVGTNAEIMKAIMGGNPKSAMLGPPQGQQVNDRGELLDHWGTPYFFHQLSKDLMEIRSAGEDQRMWTGDDIIGK
jgi:hypothetical protein